MSNGPFCCYIRACCTKSEQLEALAKKLGSIAAEDGVAELRSERVADAQAGWILDNFDLVPRGVGDAIAEAYKPLFKERPLASSEAE